MPKIKDWPGGAGFEWSNNGAKGRAEAFTPKIEFGSYYPGMIGWPSVHSATPNEAEAQGLAILEASNWIRGENKRFEEEHPDLCKNKAEFLRLSKRFNR